MKEPKTLLWDLEATNLNADFGIILCIGYTWLGSGKYNLIKITDTPEYKKFIGDDSGVVRAFAKVLSQADEQVTWYGKRFDEPFLRARSIAANLKPNEHFPPVNHTDLWETCRKELKLSSNRLASAQSFLQLPDSKTSVDRRHWNRASFGDKKSIKYILEHCILDIKVLEQAYYKLRPFIRTNRFNRGIGIRFGCAICGSKNTQARGYRRTLTSLYQRYQCQDCGAWSSAPTSGRASERLR